MEEYGYINARIRAMQGRLLTRPQYESLLAQETMKGLLEGLGNSAYGPALEMRRALLAAKGAVTPERERREYESVFDDAFRWDLAHCLSKVRIFSSDRPRALIEVLLLRWDAYNVKTILRGKRAAIPSEEILSATFPVGILDEIALAELTFTPSVQALTNTLATWRVALARPVRTALQRSELVDNLQEVEFEIDRFTFTHALHIVADGDGNDETVRAYLRLLADKANLLTALRYVEERTTLSPLEASRHFLDAEGRLTRIHYETLVSARDRREAMSKLANTAYASLAHAFPQGETLSPTHAERELDRMVIRSAIQFARQDPLGIGVAIAYLERKIQEVRNLRMILRSRFAGMAPEHILEWLTI